MCFKQKVSALVPHLLHKTQVTHVASLLGEGIILEQPVLRVESAKKGGAS